MRINEIIRERRTAKGLTQEQVASWLGVTAPAVNKWERAVSYPDITLLPSLARLLDTDLNTLLSFQEDLTQQEIAGFMEALTAIAIKNGGEQAFQAAMDKIHEFPSSGSLILNTALTLEGIFTILVKEGDTSCQMEKVWELYQRAAESQEVEVSSVARGMLASKYIDQNKYEEAEALVETLPDECIFNKKQLQAKLYMSQKRWADGAKIMEQKLLSDVSMVQTALLFLMEAAVREERVADGEKIADVISQLTELFDLWEYGSHEAHFQLAVLTKDQEKAIGALEKMIPSMLKKWSPAQSVLYCHVQEKKGRENLGEMMLPKILGDFQDPAHQEYDFLRESAKFQELMASYSPDRAGLQNSSALWRQ